MRPGDQERLWRTTRLGVSNTRQRLEMWLTNFYQHQGMHEYPWFDGVRDLLESGRMAIRRENWDLESSQGGRYEVEIRGANAVRTATTDMDAEVQREEGDLLDAIADIEDESRAAVRAHQDRLAELETRRGQLEARIRELLDLEPRIHDRDPTRRPGHATHA